MIVFILTIIIIATTLGLYQKRNNKICGSKRRLDNKTALVTGGTSGIGLEIAKDFAHRGAKVIIACPFKEEGSIAKKLIEEDSGNNNIVFRLMDLASLQSVRDFAASILETEDRLDILVNNAGVGVPNNFITKDGMNCVMQVNYFGHFLLTLLLLPLLTKTGKKSDPARIVNTSSILHRIAKLNFDDLNPVGEWLLRKIQIYGNSKLCLILFSSELTNRLTESYVVINNVDPGEVGTRIFDSAGVVIGQVITLIYGYLFKTPWEGAQTAIHVALDNGAGKVSGQFFRNCKLYPASRTSCDRKYAAKLWEESIRLVGLSDNEMSQVFQTNIIKL